MIDDGPFTDEGLKHALMVVQTQHSIIKYAESIAQILAEAGRASAKAKGDSPEYAIRQWSDVILKRALELVEPDIVANRKRLSDKFESIRKRNANAGILGKS